MGEIDYIIGMTRTSRSFLGISWPTRKVVDTARTSWSADVKKLSHHTLVSASSVYNTFEGRYLVIWFRSRFDLSGTVFRGGGENFLYGDLIPTNQ